MPRRAHLIAVVAALALVAIGCGSDDEAADTTPSSAAGGAGGGCAVADLPLKTAGTLTVATGDPAFEPWVVHDKPENGKGFESAVTYAIADQLGLAKADVTWTRTGFDEAIAPGKKKYDFNIQQFGITADRDEVVDFSDGYYTVDQAIIGRADGDLADATSLADLKKAKLGAALGTTSLDYIDDYIKPDKQPLVFDDNAAAKAAFDANQVDGIVFDLPTAYYITSAEITDSKIVGVLPQEGKAEELGLLFESGSKLISCVNTAIAALKDDGTLASLQQEWLNQGGDIPTLQP